MRIGVIGGGQLGRMLALAGYRLGHRFRFLDPSSDCPAGRVGELIVGEYADRKALARLIDDVDLVTYEFENVPLDAAQWLERNLACDGSGRPRLRPGAMSLELSQDRINEKVFFRGCGLAVQPFADIVDESDCVAAAERIGETAVIKTRRMGYDGRGQAVVRSRGQALAAFEKLGRVPCIYEAFVPFQRELSLIAVRAIGGETAFYPLVENDHGDGILRISRAPAPNVDDRVRVSAETQVARLLDELGHVGVLCVEFFEVEGRLIANEMAPRVHNSGHWTIEGSETSQFENHLRAITDLPLGSTAMRGHAAMINLIGSVPSTERLAAISGAYLHLYDKRPKPGRKLGHVTVTAGSREELETRIAQVAACGVACGKQRVVEAMAGE